MDEDDTAVATEVVVGTDGTATAILARAHTVNLHGDHRTVVVGVEDLAADTPALTAAGAPPVRDAGAVRS